ncbi:MAG: molecular chaperone DnaJ [Candidatus Latescibacteria bacterium]|nr:molecular chaperone DnaJ [Candidatus Latescibacterota bacterium]
MAKRDYYEVLGIGRESSQDEIKSAYRKQALKYHPDRNPNNPEAEEQFKEASEAYEVLSDEQKKAAYDRFGHAGVEGNFSRGGFQWSDFSHAGDFEDLFGDLFGSIFGGGGRRRRGPAGPPQGRDLKIAIELTLEEIASGVEKKIKLSRQQRCETCKGSGAKEGSAKETCKTCAGMGQVQQVARSFFGQSMVVTPCPTCSGEGSVVRDRCRDCDGEGLKRGTTQLTVRIPAGVSSGNYIPLRGQGDAGPRGGPSGDCLVFIEEKEHPHFTREGNDVHYHLPVSFSQAALGDEVEVPTLTGKARLKIQPGTQSGRVLRLGKQGIPDVEGRGVGDQLVDVVVITPSHLSEPERRLFEELARLEQRQAAEEGKSFFDKMREAFGG